MPTKQNDGFLFLDFSKIRGRKAYQKLIRWAGQARGQNPAAFDALTEWLLDDTQWTENNLIENERKLTQDVFARFKEQNAKLRAVLKELEPTGVVNAAVFRALDRFDEELSQPHEESMRETVAKVFADFSAMKERGVRNIIAGTKTGPHGTYGVDPFGYINVLKDCDAGVQWALFMPETVKKQQKGFTVESFEYRKMSAMRFIGVEGGEWDRDVTRRLEIMHTLDAVQEHRSGFDYDLLLMHHYGKGVDVEPWHGFLGRFMKAGAPVPEGFVSFDFVPEYDSAPGLPFISQFAFATFSGDMDAMHKVKGFDSDAMYDVTRNIILGEGVPIPYPEKYWTAEVFLDGCDKPGAAYLFSVND